MRFNVDRYECDDQGENKFQMYPMHRMYDERTFRRLIPAELDEVLLEMNNVVVNL